MVAAQIEIVNLSGKGLSRAESRTAAKWIAQAFSKARAAPALTIFFGASPYHQNVEMHERFWASHLNRVAKSGVLLGARDASGWCGFRAFFEPGRSRQPYETSFRLSDNEDWDRFLQLTGPLAYKTRVREWSEVTLQTNRDIGLDSTKWFTTSIIVVEPSYQSQGIGRLLDEHARRLIARRGGMLHVRIHEHVLPFYESQGYQLLASPVYTLCGSQPFVVHFMSHDCQ